MEYYLHDKVTGICLEDLLVPLGIMALEFLNVWFFLDKRHWVIKVQEERMAGRCLGLWVGTAWPPDPAVSDCSPFATKYLTRPLAFPAGQQGCNGTLSPPVTVTFHVFLYFNSFLGLFSKCDLMLLTRTP